MGQGKNKIIGSELQTYIQGLSTTAGWNVSQISKTLDVSKKDVKKVLEAAE